MTKRGQFYLIAAAIIIAIIIGLISVSNKAITSPKQTKFYDLSKDYEIETSRVIDYGIYNQYSPSVNIREKVQNISRTFAASAFAKDPNIHLEFIYGNKDGYLKENISIITPEISLGITEGDKSSQTIYQPIIKTMTGTGSNVNIKIAGNNYDFTLGPTEKFYFVIQTKAQTGETNVVVRN